MRISKPFILKVVGFLLLIASILYNRIPDDPSKGVYWTLLILGIILIMIGRFIDRLSSGGGDDT